MKYVAITGGLGNQMFIYAFYIKLQERGEKAQLFIPFENNSKRYGHQGYELEKLFHVSHYDKSSFFNKIIYQLVVSYSHLLRLFPSKWRNRLYNIVGIHIVNVPENFIFYPEVFNFNHKNELFRGTWQSELFFKNSKSRIRDIFSFDDKLLSKETLEIKNEIEKL